MPSSKRVKTTIWYHERLMIRIQKLRDNSIIKPSTSQLLNAALALGLPLLEENYNKLVKAPSSDSSKLSD